ncbi:hypothetical protein Sjap_026121 [Stephania japonica]|uniref:Uncharacterized protein n=1 Tax=Stephania japonica TaxID=461633 RepID=A0AAP0HK58_9MAGN
MTEMTENHRKILEDMIATQERMRTELMVAIRGQGAPRDPLPQMQPHIGGADLDPILEASQEEGDAVQSVMGAEIDPVIPIPEGKDPKRGAASVAGEGGVGHRREAAASPARVVTVPSLPPSNLGQHTIGNRVDDDHKDGLCEALKFLFKNCTDNKSEFKWQCIVTGLGFGIGNGIACWSVLVFYGSRSKHYNARWFSLGFYLLDSLSSFGDNRVQILVPAGVMKIVKDQALTTALKAIAGSAGATLFP